MPVFVDFFCQCCMLINNFQCVLNFLLLFCNNFFRFIANIPSYFLAVQNKLFLIFGVFWQSIFHQSRLILLSKISIIYFVIFCTFVGGTHELAEKLCIFSNFFVGRPRFEDLIFFAWNWRSNEIFVLSILKSFYLYIAFVTCLPNVRIDGFLMP